MARTFKFTLRVKDCKQSFAEGFEPGVLLTQEVVYKTAPEKDTPMFAATLMRQADDIRDTHIEVTIEEQT